MELACIEDAAEIGDESPNTVATNASGSGDDPPVTVLSIENVQGINRLSKGQTLSFAETGLTVVYGDNGAGKTGYTRILRQLCRARGETPRILGDVFLQKELPGTAELVFSAGAAAARLTCHANVASMSPLQRVSIFDSQFASALVDNENDAAFRPFGLDVLDRFTALSERIRSELQIRANALLKSAIAVEEFPDTTSVGKLLRLLPDEGAALELSLMAPLDEGEVRRWEELFSTFRELQE